MPVAKDEIWGVGCGMVKRYRVRLAGGATGTEVAGVQRAGGGLSDSRPHPAALRREPGRRRHEGRGDCQGPAGGHRHGGRCVEEGLEAALGRRQQLNRRQRKLDGAGEARLIALTCSQPPCELADQLVECETASAKRCARPWKECIRSTIASTGTSLTSVQTE